MTEMKTPNAPTDTPPPDLTKHAAGTFDPKVLGGAPADAVKRFFLGRVGCGPRSLDTDGLEDLRLDDPRAGVMRVPSPFPPEGYGGPLQTIADLLNCVDVCKAVPPPAEKSPSETPQAEQKAA